MLRLLSPGRAFVPQAGRRTRDASVWRTVAAPAGRPSKVRPLAISESESHVVGSVFTTACSCSHMHPSAFRGLHTVHHPYGRVTRARPG